MKLNIDFIIPEKLTQPFGWIGHIPFIQWLVKNYKPKNYVELGTHKGNSYFAVCQAVKKYGTKTACFAVDSWEGEEHAGYYDDDVYKEVNEWNKNKYIDFSVLIKALFDDALSLFKDNSIDLLHIDGLHTYEAVKHDFEAWLPKLTENSLVLFHDINLHRDDFGVYKLWEELKSKYITFSFLHSYGLGVLFAGDNCDVLPKEIQYLFNADNSNVKYLIREQFVSRFSIMNDAFMSEKANSWDSLPESYLFYSKNSNFEQNKCLSKKIVRSEKDHSFELVFNFETAKYTKRLRWDPIDGSGCRISNLKIDVFGDLEKSYSLNECQTNGVINEGEGTFYTIDPIVEVDYKGHVEKVVITGCIKYISVNDIEQYYNNRIKNINEEIQIYRLRNENLKKVKENLWKALAGERNNNEQKYLKLKWINKVKKTIWAIKHLKASFRYKKSKKTISESILFNAEFYLASNTDLFLHCFDAVDHYLRYGWNESRNPSEYFDISFYLNNNPDIIEKKIEPLSHYLTFGWKEGRNPHPLFDVKYYKSRYIPNNKRDEIEPFEHYITVGWKLGNNPNQFFDVEVYLENAHINEEPLMHYKKFGLHNDIPFTNDKVLREQIAHLNMIKNGNGLEFLLLNRDLFRHIDISELFFNIKKEAFNKYVTIVVPVFVKCQKSLKIFQNLIDSLKTAYPFTNEFISFVLIDDASIEKAVLEYYNREEFFKRKDVLIELTDKNKGFLLTINRGIELCNNFSDVVILNSDTEVFSGTFETLQNVAYRDNHIASVTPLSNKAILSSITNWPHGDDSIYQIPNDIVSEIIRAIGLKTPEIEVPTGHGFCMYMKREVIDQVGIFREDLYGRGYGEENDWCQRAIEKGYNNIITTECFVFHNDTTSFTKEEKFSQGGKNIVVLNGEFPNYNRDVAHYIRKDEHKEYRNLIKIELQKYHKKEKKLKTFLFMLHDSVESSLGGTQLHVNELAEMLKCHASAEIFILAPISYNNYDKMRLHYYNNFGDDCIFESVFSNVYKYLMHLEERIDILHVHHFQQMPEKLLDFMVLSDISKKVITLHDYSAFCDNLFLLDNNHVLCNVEDNYNCISCGKSVIESRRYFYLLKVFDVIFVPSENMYNIINSMKFVGDEILSKIVVLKHFLFFEKIIPKIKNNSDIGNNEIKAKKIVFLGVAVKHKGINLFVRIIEKLKLEGYHPEIWGENCGITDVVSRKFEGWQELYMLQKTNQAYIFVMPSLCPETFSYTLYEAIYLLDTPVVVGPYGNPAEVVKEYKLGISIEKLDSNILYNAIKDIDNDYGFYKNNIKQFIKNKIDGYTHKRFLREYLDKVNSVDYNYKEKAILGPEFYESKICEISSVKKMRILYFSEFTGLDEGPWRYRVHNIKLLLEMSGCSVKIAKENDYVIFDEMHNYDAAIFHRVNFSEYFRSLISKAKKNNVFLIYDSDDLVFFKGVYLLFPFWDSLDKRSKDEYKRLVPKQLETAVKCDAVSCGTQMISTYARYIEKNSFVFRNFVMKEDFDNIERKKENKKVTIGIFSGSHTHDKDLEFLVPLLIKTAEVREMNFIIMGQFNTESYKEIPNTIYKPFTDYKSYIKTIAKCNLVAVPSSMVNDFIVSKSAVKFLEAAALKVPVIASPLPEFKRYIEHGFNGWIAETIDDWENILLNLPSLSKLSEVGENAFKRLNKDSILSKELAEYFNKLLQTVIFYK